MPSAILSNEKRGMPLYEMHVFPSNDDAIIPKWKPDYNSISKPNASTMRVKKCKNA